MHNYPKLHNAMWPGLVGKEAGTDHPPISLDRMLELTANAEVNGQKFEGIDYFLFHPHTDPDASDGDLRKIADKIAGYNLKVGSLVAPVWPGTVGASAMGSDEDRKKFLLAVKKACRIAKIFNDHGVRQYGVIRIDSAEFGIQKWKDNPRDGTKRIAQTFKLAAKIAADHGERLAAEGEICWAGMHSWKDMLNLLEAVGMPETLGFQADLAHTYLYLMGYNAPEHALLKPGYSKEEFWDAYKTMTDALRPWTIDFHVAQNNGEVHGTGSHEKTGKHCPADDPNGKVPIVEAAKYWLKGAAHRGIKHICWDGCMFPNKMLETPKIWNTILDVMMKVRDAAGWTSGPVKGKPSCTHTGSTLAISTEGKKPVRIGLVGYGFMGRTHSNGYRKAPTFFDTQHVPVLQAVCARDEAKVKAFAKQWGYASYETDWRELVKREDIDAIDICTPNNSHAQIAIAAAKAGKMILCEKPLAMNTAEGLKMVAAVQKAGVPNTVWYNYRRVPAVTLAKQLIDEGRLGQVFHYRAQFLQDWTISADLPQGGAGLWRLDVKAAGSGVTGDLLAHCIDSAMWLNGPITQVSAITETFIKQRKHTITGKVEKVGIDDACIFMCRFANGSLGVFESTRYARGHKAKDTLEINGANASIAWDLHDQHRLQYFDHHDQGIVRGWRNVHVSDGDQPYHKNWWVPGLQIGYEHTFVHQVADFLKSLDEGKPCHPTFKDALETQRVCDAVLKSAKSGKWEKTGVKDFA